MIVHIDGKDAFLARRPDPDAVAPPLVLLHGAVGQHGLWMDTARHISGATVYAPDLPGHGRTPGEASETIAGYAEFVLGLLKTLGIEKAVLGGHSMGGAIALHTALTYPEKVDGLVLASTGARMKVSPKIMNTVADDPSAFADMFVKWAFGPTVTDETRNLSRAAVLAMDPEVNRRDFAACDAFDVRDRLKEISVPTLILTGRKDLMTPIEYTVYLAGEIPNSEVDVIDQAGHMTLIEVPDILAQHISTWLKETWGS